MNIISILAGLLLLFVSFASSNVTLTTGDYRNALRFALACSTMAAACFVVPLVRGPKRWRVAAAVLMFGVALEILDLLPRMF